MGRLQAVRTSVHIERSQCSVVLKVHMCKLLTLSLRYIFLEYASPAHAVDAVKNADGYKLDKQHTFRVNLFTDFDK